MLVAVARHDHVYHHSKRSTLSYNPLPLKVGLKPNIPSSSISAVFGMFARQHACPEKLSACSAIHRALDRLQAVDLALSLAVAPRKFNGVVNSIDVTA